MEYVFLFLGFLGTIINIILIINHLVEKFILKTNPYKNRLVRGFDSLSVAIASFFALYLLFFGYGPNPIFAYLRLEELASKNICSMAIYLFFITFMISALVEIIFPVKYQQVKADDNQEFYYKKLSRQALIIVLIVSVVTIIRGTGVLITNTLSPPWSVISLYRKLYYIYKVYVLSFVYILIFLKSYKISLKIAGRVNPIKKEPFDFVYGIDNIGQPQRKKLYNLSIVLIFFYIVYLFSTFFIKLSYPNYAVGKELHTIIEMGIFSFSFIMVYFSTIFFVSNRNEKEIFFKKIYDFSFIFLILVPYIVFPMLFKLYISIKKTAINNKDTIFVGIIIVLATTIMIKFLDYSFKIKKPKEKKNNL